MTIQISISMTGGPCQATTFSSRIDFVCQPNAHIGYPELVTHSACYAGFRWITATACPVQSRPTHDCVLTDDATSQVYNLTALRLSTGQYSVTTSNAEFDLNVCGNLAVPCGPVAAAVCQRSYRSHRLNHSLGVGPGQFAFDANGVLTLTYHHGGLCHSNGNWYNRSTVISFICDQNVNPGQPRSVGDSQCVYNFVWNTIYACPIAAQAVPCMAVDPASGALYDLSPLSSSTANWLASDVREGGKFSYEFNVCRALVDDGSEACDPSMAACQTVAGGSDYGLGLAASPVVVSPGHVRIVYAGGDVCRNGVSRTMQLDLLCPYESNGQPRPDVVGTPAFDFETSCNYTLTWTTSYACPISHGPACSVFDPDTGAYYDLSRQAAANHVLAGTGSSAGDTFALRVCGSPAVCSGGSGACLGVKGIYSSLGRPNYYPQIVPGGLQLTYSLGASCSPTQLASTQISFVCAPSAGTGQPHLDANSTACLTHIIWPTADACPQPPPVDCVAQDPYSGAFFDLTSLERVGGWVVHSPLVNSSLSLVVGVCQTLACGGGACLGSQSLGEVGPPIVEGGSASLQYYGSCSTRIDFVCGHGPLQSSPALVYISPSCVYHFVWETAVACSNASAAPVGAEDCAVQDADSGLLYTLAPLRQRGPLPVLSPNKDGSGRPYRYLLSVCAPLPFACGNSSTAAACQIGHSNFSLGQPSSAPFLVGGVVTLQYSNGPICPSNKSPRKSLVAFPCDPTAGWGMPIYQTELSDCTYVFTYATNVTCSTSIGSTECTAFSSNGAPYNLGQLTKYVSHSFDPHVMSH